MRYQEFVRRVEARAAGGLDQEGAERAIRSTLATLSEALSAEEASDLAAQLPSELKPALVAGGHGERLAAGEFLRRVAEREGMSRSEALDHSRAVTDVLAEAVTAGELADIRAELADEMQTVFKRPAARAHRSR